VSPLWSSDPHTLCVPCRGWRDLSGSLLALKTPRVTTDTTMTTTPANAHSDTVAVSRVVRLFQSWGHRQAVVLHTCNPCRCRESGGRRVQGHIARH
jgi:hypothetical protein